MSHGDEFLQEERLRVRLVALRRGLARLSPTTQSEYGTWITEAEGQLHRNVQGPVLVRRLLEEIEASPSASSSSWTAGRTTPARKVSMNVNLCRRTGGWTLRPHSIPGAATTTDGAPTMPVPQRTVADEEFGRATRLQEDPDR